MVGSERRANVEQLIREIVVARQRLRAMSERRVRVLGMQKTPKIGDKIIYHSHGDGDMFGFVVAVHNSECVNLIAWNRGGTQQTHTSVLAGSDPGRFEFAPAD